MGTQTKVSQMGLDCHRNFSRGSKGVGSQLSMTPDPNAIRLIHNSAPQLCLLHSRDKRPPVRMVVL